MIFFGFIKILQREHFYYYGFTVLSGKCSNSFVDKRFFGVVYVIDACAVLRATVVALFVEGSGVDNFEIEVEQLVEVDELRVVGYFYGFGKTCIACRYLFVTGGFGEFAIGITYFGGENSANLFKEVFGAPEATSCKIDVSRF